MAWAPDNETFLFGCRPNSLAGRPSLHAPLTIAEAARSDVSRQSRAHLHTAIDEEISWIKDEKQRMTLIEYRDALDREEQVQDVAGGLLGSPAVDADKITQGIDAGAGSIILGASVQQSQATPPGDLPESIRELAEEHSRTLQDEMKKLGRDF